MKETIKNDMYAKIQNAKAIAAKALGQVDLGAKTLAPKKPTKANIEQETKVTENTAAKLESQAPKEDKKNIRSLLLKKPAAPKKVDAETEQPNTKSKLVGESAAGLAGKEVKKVSDEKTKAKALRNPVKAKIANAKETSIKK